MFLSSLFLCLMVVDMRNCCKIPGTNRPCQKVSKKFKLAKHNEQVVKSTLRENLVKERFRRQLGLPRLVSDSAKKNRLPAGILEALWKETQENSLAEKLVPSTEIKKMIIHATKARTSSCTSCVHFLLKKSILAKEVTSADLWIHLGDSTNCNDGQNTILQLYKLNKNRPAEKALMGEHTIPRETCGWHKLQVTDFTNWTTVTATNPDMLRIDLLMELVCVDCLVNMRQLPYIGLGIESEVKQRTRRDTACKPGVDACCIDDLHVNITDIVHQTPSILVMPKTYNVGMCRGTCENVHSASDIRGGLVNAASIAKKGQQMMLCCAPTKYESLSTLVSIDGSDVSERIIEDIIVTECGCV